MGAGASSGKPKKKKKKAELVLYELEEPDTPTFAWVSRFDEDANEYFENTVSGETQWEVRDWVVIILIYLSKFC